MFRNCYNSVSENCIQAKDYTLQKFEQSKNYALQKYDWTLRNGKKAWEHVQYYGIVTINFGGTAATKSCVLGKTAIKWTKEQPIYQRNITPLKKFDYCVLGASVGLAFLITVIALKILGIAVLPVIVWSACMCLLAAGSIARYRLNNYFDREACKELVRIRQRLNEPLINNEDKKIIAQAITNLKKPEFDHHKTKWETLEKDYRSFIKKSSVYSYEQHQKQVLSQLNLAIQNIESQAEIKRHDQNGTMLKNFKDLRKALQKKQDKLEIEQINELLNKINNSPFKIFIGNINFEKLNQSPSTEKNKNDFHTKITSLIRELGGKPDNQLADIDEDEIIMDDVGENNGDNINIIQNNT